MKPLVSMREALADDELFGLILPGDSWLPWRVLLIAMMGEPLTDSERVIWTSLTKREREPLLPVEEFWGVVGRRGGKTRAMSVVSAYLAGLCDWSDVLVPGERGRLFYLAHTSKQAGIAFDYAKSIFTDRPLFASMADRITADTITLTNRIDLEVRAATWRGLRGVTAIGAIFDELAFFQSEDISANTDREILTAVRPSLATTSGPLIAISSPFGKSGEVYRAVESHFGPESDPLILVARGASRTFNPSLPQKVVDRAMERDALAARAEYLGEFRDDVAAFVDVATVEACIRKGHSVWPPQRQNMPYFAFCDPSGGRSDSMTLAIGHDEPERDRTIVDVLMEVEPPFSPETTVIKFAELLLSYGLRTVVGDAYAGEWVKDAFARYRIAYLPSKLNKTEIFLNLLPALNSKTILLPDNGKLVSQLTSLQRRTTGAGREAIDHMQNRHDDVANAAAGCLVHLIRARRMRTLTQTTTHR